MKVTGYKDSNGNMHWCVHTPCGLAPFAAAKDAAIDVAGDSVQYAMSFGHVHKWNFARYRKVAGYRKVASFNVEQRNAK